jgi:anti-sigma factor RsiW
MSDDSMNDDDLSALIRDHATRHRAGSRLRAALRMQITLQAAAHDDDDRPIGHTEGQGTRHPRRAALPRRWGAAWREAWQRPWFAFASGALLAALVTWTLIPATRIEAPAAARALQDPSASAATESALVTALVTAHVQALRQGPVQVASSDRHTVKPWFQGRIDYAPPVLDLKADGFELLGGRVDALADQPTAVLVYGLRKHIVSLSVRPDDHESAPVAVQRRGFNLMHWSDGRMGYWLVSDTESSELHRLRRVWIERVASR